MLNLYYYLRAVAVHAVRVARRTWKWGNWAEVALVALTTATSVLSIVALNITDAGILWAVTVAAVFTAGSTVRTMMWNASERYDMAMIMSTEPSGAPRLAEVRCSRDRVHRLEYGPGGWREIGPGSLRLLDRE